MLDINITAPYRIILSGLHGLIYSKAVIAVAIDKKMTLQTDYKKKLIDINEANLIKNTVIRFIQKQNPKILIDKDIYCNLPFFPQDNSIGEQSTYIVATTAYLLTYFLRKKPSIELINTLSYQSEKKIVPQVNGLDCSCITNGGLFFYRKEFEFLKGIYQLQFKIPKVIEDNLYIIDTGKPNETEAEMIEHVGSLFNQNAKKIQTILNEIEKCTKRLVVSIAKEDKSFFKETLKENEVWNEQLGVVTGKNKKLIRDIEKEGAASLISYGGLKENSGKFICYIEDRKYVKYLSKDYNFSFTRFNQSKTGVVTDLKLEG